MRRRFPRKRTACRLTPMMVGSRWRRIPANGRNLPYSTDLGCYGKGRLRGVCHERRMSYLRRATVREMKEGPSRPAVRCRSQATTSCRRQKRWW